MSLFDHLTLVEENRSHINQRHNLVDVMFLILSAISTGAEGWQDIEIFGDLKLDWLRQYRAFKHGIPRRHTIARIVESVDCQSLMLALLSWVNQMREHKQQPLIALDGKALRGSYHKNPDDALHSVAAYDVDNGLFLYQEMTEGKGCEIAAVREVLNVLNITDAVITLDALHCQRDTLQLLTSRGADYVVQVKANQKLLNHTVKEQFAQAFENQDILAQSTTSEKAHGRIETRTVFQVKADFSDELSEKWPSVKTLVAVERDQNNVIDTKYYLSSLDINPELAGKCVREHWAIENSLHWILDVVYKEDICRVREKKAAENLAMFRRVSLNIAKQETSVKDSMKGKLIRASYCDNYRSTLLFGTVKSS
ncbi:ISAs1 family transposase (plasmid) [Photobacterium sp. GJ3]|uniref:ISAs1 family transposase n=1 Tax=Photobacterium sp. GJ3 TaxID=2829502 RepID=UPI001B8AAC7A|nr:ISAs1 family transposase [Photobacterium sp. GJ3]QUJ69700.1 ISAs1 family transposase [Photobacterium sp. GJ3]